MVREWIIYNKLEDFNSLLNLTVDDFTLSGNLCYSNDNGEILHQTPLQELLNKHSMTPKQLKKNPIEPIIKVKPHQKLDTDEGESAKDEEESTTSTELSGENSTSDTPTEVTEESKSIEASQVNNVFIKSTQDEADSFEDKPVTEFELSMENGEQNSNLTIEIENRKVEGLITYSLDQQIFKLKDNSRKNLELWE